MKANEIAKIIAHQHNITIKDANAFCQHFVETIQQALDNDGQVKINGLGTFKLSEVKPRESINVNTGERQLIPAYNKITFTPASKLKDIINKPFEQFETVMVKDGVNLPDTEEVVSVNFDEDTITDEPSSPEEQLPNETEIVADNKESEEVAAPTKESSVAQTVSPATEFAVEQPAAFVTESSFEQPTLPETEPILESYKQQNNRFPREETVSVGKTGTGLKKYLYVILPLLAVCILAMVLLKTCKSNEQIQPVNNTPQVVEKKQEPSQDELNKQNLLKKVNEQLRNLPYDIVDIYDTIPARTGMTPRSLAPTYGGAGTEIYIKVLNDNKAIFEEGEDVYIPILELKE